jgi:3-phosphoshikimate 1-carboxyvinyltransferase
VHTVVEGDYSQAAFFIAGAAVAGDVAIEGLSPASLQPDKAIVDIMRRMGADIERCGNTLRVKKSVLRAIDVNVSQYPDLVPPIAAAAVFAQGTTRIFGAARLRIKESDRLRALSENFDSLWISSEEIGDTFIIHGGSTPQKPKSYGDSEIKGREADSFGDHRIAMMLSVIALDSESGITIKGAECVSKSYPKFFEDLKALGGKIS